MTPLPLSTVASPAAPPQPLPRRPAPLPAWPPTRSEKRRRVTWADEAGNSRKVARIRGMKRQRNDGDELYDMDEKRFRPSREDVFAGKKRERERASFDDSRDEGEPPAKALTLKERGDVVAGEEGERKKMMVPLRRLQEVESGYPMW